VEGAWEEKAVVASKEIKKKTVTMLEDIVDDFDLNWFELFFSSCCYFEKKEREILVMNEKKKRNVYLYERM
jgi:hypothetical protein